MRPDQLTEADRLKWLAEKEESDGPLGTCSVGSPEFAQSDIAISLCIENFQAYVLRSPAVLKDPELYAAAEKAYEAMTALSLMFIDREVRT